MADGHGGYRTPSKPASVSGPGALSARTDRGRPGDGVIPDAAYGESKVGQEMATSGKAAQANAAAYSAPMDAGRAQAELARAFSGVKPLTTPGDPSEPVTAGADAGPGPGSEVLGILPEGKRTAEYWSKYAVVLQRIADNPNATQAAKDWALSILPGVFK